MGIKHLNRFLHKHCTENAVKHTYINAFKNKTLVIDTSIFMYKFLTATKTQEGVLQNIQKMIQLFDQHGIIPIFVFDGKPPEEKSKLLKQRYWKKVLAYRKAEKLKQLLLDQSACDGAIADNDANTATIKKEIEIAEIESLRLTKNMISDIKEYICSQNRMVIEASEEADEICVKYVKMREAYAVISDDMDMLVHGCPITIRNLDIETGKCVKYHMYEILQELNLTIQQFREIIVLSGTDYSDTNVDHDLYKTLKLYTNYRKFLKMNKWRNLGFLEFVIQYTSYVTNVDETQRAYEKFTFTDRFDPPRWKPSYKVVEMNEPW
jgi:flap endonuclease-1